jgi:hypothetical protein
MVEIRMADFCETFDNRVPPTRAADVDIERLLIRAYAGLALATEEAGGARTTTLARIGAYEVRLCEIPPENALPGVRPLWLDVFCRSSRSTIDSRGCFDLDDAEPAAEELVAEARRRNSRPLD